MGKTGKAVNIMIETERNHETSEMQEYPDIQALGAESTEAAWRALGVIEGICSVALMEEHLPQVLKQLEIIAEALR